MANTVTVPGPHLTPFTGAVGAADTELTVAVTIVLVAEIQPVAVFLVWA